MTSTPAAPDADLLAAFAATRDEAAFAELVRRHGPLVHGVCRRTLGRSADADDAYQAVLVVLARKAGAVRDPARLGPWLYGVAVRCAGRARGRAAARSGRERPLGDPAARPPADDWADVGPVLDAEIERLPDKLRTALVLCELQGLDRTQAAARLGVPEGTVSSRLARAKDTLRGRLVRRGVTLSAAGLAAATNQTAAAAPAAGTPSAAALAIANQETTMLVHHVLFKLLLALATAVGLAAVGVGLAPTGPPVDPVAADKAKLLGEWKIVSAKADGQEPTGRDKEKIIGRVVTFKADGVEFQVPCTYAIDPTKTPKHMDLVPLGGPPGEKGGKAEAVYELDGDTLRVNMVGARRPGRANPARPKDFVSRAGDGYVSLVLERVKK